MRRPSTCPSLSRRATAVALAAALMIGGCGDMTGRQQRQENDTSPAAAGGQGGENAIAGSDTSQDVRELRRLYAQLQDFKDDAEFHRVEFGRCCQYYRWKQRVDEVSNRSGPALLRELGFAPAELVQLASTYARTRGRPNDLTRTIEGRIRNGLEPAAPSAGTGILRTAGRWCTDIHAFEDYIRGMETRDMELMSRPETDPSCREYPIGTGVGAVLAERQLRVLSD